MSSPLHPELKDYCRKSYIAGSFLLLFSLFGLALFLNGYFVVKQFNTVTIFLKGLLTYMVFFGGAGFYGLREILTAPKRYSQLEWVLKSVAPIEMQVLLYPQNARKLTYYAELRPLKENFARPPSHKLELRSPTWNVSSIVNKPIQAKVYFHPNSKYGGVIIIENRFLVWLPNLKEGLVF